LIRKWIKLNPLYLIETSVNFWILYANKNSPGIKKFLHWIFPPFYEPKIHRLLFTLYTFQDWKKKDSFHRLAWRKIFSFEKIFWSISIDLLCIWDFIIERKPFQKSASADTAKNSYDYQNSTFCSSFSVLSIGNISQNDFFPIGKCVKTLVEWMDFPLWSLIQIKFLMSK